MLINHFFPILLMEQKEYIKVFEDALFRDFFKDLSRIPDNDFEYTFSKIEFMHLQIDCWIVQCNDQLHKRKLKGIKRDLDKVYKNYSDERVRRRFFNRGHGPKNGYGKIP